MHFSQILSMKVSLASSTNVRTLFDHDLYVLASTSNWRPDTPNAAKRHRQTPSPSHPGRHAYGSPVDVLGRSPLAMNASRASRTGMDMSSSRLHVPVLDSHTLIASLPPVTPTSSSQTSALLIESVSPRRRRGSQAPSDRGQFAFDNLDP